MIDDSSLNIDHSDISCATNEARTVGEKISQDTLTASISTNTSKNILEKDAREKTRVKLKLQKKVRLVTSLLAKKSKPVVAKKRIERFLIKT